MMGVWDDFCGAALQEMANFNRATTIAQQSPVTNAEEDNYGEVSSKPSEPSRQSGSSASGWDLIELLWGTKHALSSSILDQVDTLFRPRRYELSTNQPKLRDHGGPPRKHKSLHSPFRGPDRQSFVEGTSVSSRVALGV